MNTDRTCLVQNMLIIMKILLFTMLVLKPQNANAEDVIQYIKTLYHQTNITLAERKAQEMLIHTGPPDYGPGSNENKKEKWYKIGHSEDMKVFEGSDYKAKVYFQNNKVIKVIIVSIGEGWNDSVEYYFYPGGTTAFVFERLKTMQGYNTDKEEPLPPGPYIVEWRTYFDKTGKIIKELKKAFYESNNEDIPLKYVRTSIMNYGYYYHDYLSFPFSAIIKAELKLH